MRCAAAEAPNPLLETSSLTGAILLCAHSTAPQARRALNGARVTLLGLHRPYSVRSWPLGPSEGHVASGPRAATCQLISSYQSGTSHTTSAGELSPFGDDSPTDGFNALKTSSLRHVRIAQCNASCAVLPLTAVS